MNDKALAEQGQAHLPNLELIRVEPRLLNRMVSKFGSAPIELEDRQIAARNGKWWIQLEVQHTGPKGRQ